MKIISLILLLSVVACASYNREHSVYPTQEEDNAAHQAYLEEIYTTYDFEYIDDCLTYVELVCEFE
jgi:hypothetical protein